MKQLSQEEMDKIFSRLYWDLDVKKDDLYRLINKKTKEIVDIKEINFYCRLLSSCDWYSILKLLPHERIGVILSDTVINKLYPKDLRGRFLYARKVLSR